MKITRNLWPLGIVLMLVLFFCGIITLVVIASSHQTELVSSNYYEQEIEYQKRIDGLARAHQIGAAMSYDAKTRRMVFSLNNDSAAASASARVELYRPSAAGLDHVLPLLPGADGTQVADLSELQPGLWRVRASWSVDGRDYLLEGSLTNSAAAH